MQFMRTRTNSKLVERAEASGHLTFVHGDIGPTKHLGFPKGPVSPERAMNYVGAINRTGHKHYDTVLVDGRWRLACLLYSRSFLKQHGGAALIHDFVARPPGSKVDIWRARFSKYSRALQHYGLEQQEDTLALLKPFDTTITQRELTAALRSAER